jgi:ferredoxin
MLKLIVDEALCVRCGNCDAWLPGLLDKVWKGVLLINEANPAVDTEAVQKAVDCCHLDAITLEVVE